VFAFFRSIIPYSVPVFAVFTMLNVGLTQKLSAIIGHLKNFPFVLKMLAANFIVAPLLMIIALKFAPFDPALKAGLLVFSLCAGAPFLIKLTQTAEHNIALGAAVMMLLMAATVIYTPVVLPLFCHARPGRLGGRQVTAAANDSADCRRNARGLTSPRPREKGAAVGGAFGQHHPVRSTRRDPDRLLPQHGRHRRHGRDPRRPGVCRRRVRRRLPHGRGKGPSGGRGGSARRSATPPPG